MIKSDFSKRKRTRKPSKKNTPQSAELGKVKWFFSSILRIILLIVVSISMVVFAVLWWWLPNYLAVKQDQLVIVPIESAILLMQLQADKPARVFELSEELTQELRDTAEYEPTAKFFSTELGVIIDDVMPVEGLSMESIESRSSRTEFLVRNGTNFVANDSLFAVLHLHIGLNKSSISPDLTRTGIKKLASSNPSIERSLAFSCPVAIVNSTDKRGLARSVAEVLETSGVVVVRVDDQEETLESTKMLSDGVSECGDLKEKMKTLLHDEPQIETNAELTKKYRASIVVILGEDLKIEEE